MRAICRFNRSSDLADHQRGRFASVDSRYPLSVGVGYVVVGMGVWENVLSFLVRDDIGRPVFAPAGLFECGEDVIPSHWSFALREGISASGPELWVRPCSAIWGYSALVGDPGHPGALEEGDESALAVFFAELRAADESEAG